MHKTGTVVIVDDHPMIRFAVRTLLEQNGWHVSAEAGSGIEGLAAARQHRPDLVVLDIGIPRMDGLMVIGRLCSNCNGKAPRVVVLSAQNPEHMAARCLHAGASGFVYKGKELQELVGAAKAVMRGNSYFPSVALRLDTPTGSPAGEETLIKRLSDRELVVLQHLARGALNKAIAGALMLSEKTISTYKSRLQEKLHAATLVELTDIARRNGLV